MGLFLLRALRARPVRLVLAAAAAARRSGDRRGGRFFFACCFCCCRCLWLGSCERQVFPFVAICGAIRAPLPLLLPPPLLLHPIPVIISFSPFVSLSLPLFGPTRRSTLVMNSQGGTQVALRTFEFIQVFNLVERPCEGGGVVTAKLA